MKFGLGTAFKLIQKTLSTFYLIKFLLNKVEDKTVLLFEANNCHTELFPSFVKYLKDLGYNVEIAVSINQKGFLPKLGVKNVYYLMLKGMKKLLKTKKLKDYKLIIFTSYRLYYPHPTGLSNFSKVFEQFEIKYPPKLGSLFVLHHLEDYDEKIEKMPCAVVLSDILRKKGNLYTINPCYFIENSPNSDTKKNKIKNSKKTVFITTGTLDSKRKNAELLYEAARNLLKNGVKDFEVKVAGDNKKDIVPDDLKDFIKIEGRLNFKKLYQRLQAADFYLPLLDPEFQEHKRYIENGTSGSFQLIRGFLIPPVIHKTFALPHKFSAENAIIYEENKDLSSAMKTAINMTSKERLALKERLYNSRLDIMQKSKDTLQTLFGMLEDKSS